MTPEARHPAPHFMGALQRTHRMVAALPSLGLHLYQFRRPLVGQLRLANGHGHPSCDHVEDRSRNGEAHHQLAISVDRRIEHLRVRVPAIVRAFGQKYWQRLCHYLVLPRTSPASMTALAHGGVNRRTRTIDRPCAGERLPCSARETQGISRTACAASGLPSDLFWPAVFALAGAAALAGIVLWTSWKRGRK